MVVGEMIEIDEGFVLYLLCFVFLGVFLARLLNNYLNSWTVIQKGVKPCGNLS